MLTKTTFEFVVGRKDYFQNVCNAIASELDKDKIDLGYISSKLSILEGMMDNLYFAQEVLECQQC